ncbi:MAG: HD domain-containing protein [Deltaproteobacteria bacterium]|nr:MAG: HD domain-containing protein [Deltaproteobacteria bacterium]
MAVQPHRPARPVVARLPPARRGRRRGGQVVTARRSSVSARPAKDRVFRDPVHGLVEFRGDDRALIPLVDARPMQRLRRIRQMGFASLVYPGAEHSRFGHALGAFCVAQRVCAALDLDPDVARHVKVAALLHDVGHGPFSHAWEQAFGADDHEVWGARLVSEHAELAAAIDAIESGLPATLAAFWDKTYRPTYARKLVSSQLDVDRLDYLLRDGHYSGAGYATYDLDWILYALRVEPVGGDREDLVVDYRRGMYAVEQYLFARSYMYAQVYHHKTVRAAEWMFLKLMRRYAQLARDGAAPDGLPAAAGLARGERVSVDTYLELDDVAVTAAVDRWARDAADPVIRDLADRLVARRLFKTVELGDDRAVAERVAPAAARIAEAAFGDRAPYYYEIDTADRVGYAAAGAAEELYVVGHPRRGAVPLGQLLEDMPLGRPISTLRLVCAPELVDDMRAAAARAIAA